MKQQKGYTLLEALLVMILMAFIMSAIYFMIMYYRDVAGTEQARVRQTQESRYLLSIFSSELKNAGAVLTMTDSGSFLTTASFFNGIYPLNNTNFPDGVILASGDPNGVAKLTAAITPSINNVLQVSSTSVTPTWGPGDKGILIGPNGFYVFSVESVSMPTTITMKVISVYYSGLLDTTHYKDPEAVGNTLEYPENSPVVRLTDFSIYLVNEHDGKRDLVNVTDCKGKGTENDIFGTDSEAVKGVVAENIWDLQISYTAYPNFPDVTTKNDFFSSGAIGTFPDLLTAIRTKTFKEMTVNLVALTDDYSGKGSITYSLPVLADRASTTIPAGKFNYKTYSFLIASRNYNISL